MVFDKCKQIVADQMGIDPESITMDSKLIEDIGADSLDTVEILLNIENEFGIELEDGVVENFTTFKDVVEYVESLI
ncbi:MAG: acyl carrier protein [Clostridia bacterium]|nr:acyl carrier protein [Clostridia bacterium]MDY5264092.1 acyl carrier protein [Eubacteriales bacterium]MDY5439676.1 acyl carrier protein [Eubacteriales bacterium]